MEVNNGNKSDSMKKVEKQNNLNVMTFFSFSSFLSVLAIFAFIIFHSFVSPRNSTHLNIITCANHMIVLPPPQKKKHWLNGYMIFPCVCVCIYICIYHIYPIPPLGQDMTQDQSF